MKKNQQRIHLCRGQIGPQVNAEGRPRPIGQEFLQRYDEAVKRRAAKRARNTPTGGV